MQGGHHVGTNIHGCQPYLKIAIYVLKSANGGLLCRPLYMYYYTLQLTYRRTWYGSRREDFQQCIAHVLADHRLTVQELGIGVQRGILGHEVA